MRSISKPSGEKLPIVGWREWLALPDLGIPAIKAKIDTGARTSAIHTFYLQEFAADGCKMVRFGVHPLQKRRDVELFCEAPVIDSRRIKDSSGNSEFRYVIETKAVLLGVAWPIQITLTNRDTMAFRMLMGRTALERRFIIDPGRSYCGGRKPAKLYTSGFSKKGKL